MAPEVMSDEAREQAPDHGDGTTPARRPAQPSLPFEEAAAADDPIPYGLTARARRTVAPASLPELSVVPDPAGAPGTGEEPDPFDPRPARARALRRAGRDLPEIAGLLAVDEDLVTAWCRTVGPRADRRRARAAGRRSPSGDGGSGGGPVAGSGAGEVRRLPLPGPDRSAQRTLGHGRAAEHLAGAGPAAVVVAYVAGRSRLTAHAATFPVDDPDEAARIVGWLVDLAGADPSRARLVLEVGRGAAHDLVEARWQQGTGIAAEHITVAVGDRDVRATLRIADPDVAAVLAGWQDAVVEASREEV